MRYQRKLTPRTRHVHSITIEDDVWAWLIEHCLRHNMNPGDVVEQALPKHLDPELKEQAGGF